MENKFRRKARALTLSVAVVTTLVGTTSVYASTESACQAGYLYTIPTYSSKHMPEANAIFKDGPGPLTVQVSVEQSGSVSFTGSVSGGATVNGIVAEVKVEVTASATQTSSVTVGHTVTKSVGAGKYLHSEYGSWGNQVTWKYWWQKITCERTLQSSSTAKVPTTQMGWRFYETTY